MIRRSSTSWYLVCLGVMLMVTSGCLDAFFELSEDDPGLPPLGMGLEVPDELPLPGPFLEGPDLLLLEEFLFQEGRQILKECEREHVADGVESLLVEERYAKAINAFMTGCATQGYHQIAQQAMVEGNEKGVYQDLMVQANASMKDLRQRLNNHTGPGNAVEASFLSHAMGRNILGELSLIRSAPLFWEPYEDGRARDQLQLRNAYMQPYRNIQYAEVVVKTLERYPWTSPPCVPPDVPALTQQIEETIDLALDKAVELGHDGPGEWGRVNPHYEEITVWLEPELELAKQDDWWPRLLSLKVSVEGRLAYFESFSAPAWPTFEEAEYLLAQFRNETRSAYTEQAMDSHISYFSDEFHQSRYDWDTDITFGPPGFMRLMALSWPYEGLDCPANPTTT